MPHQTQILPVTGMDCASCANIITRKLQKLSGVESVHVNVASEKAKVVYDPEKISISSMNKEIEKMGYRLEDAAESVVFEAVVHQTGQRESRRTESNHSEHAKHQSHITTETHRMPDGSVMAGMHHDGMDHSAHLGLGQSKEKKLEELAKQKRLVQFTLPLSLFMFGLTLWDMASATIRTFPPLPLPMDILNTVLFLLATVVIFGAGKIFINAVVRFIQYRSANMDTLVGIGTLSAYIYSSFVTLFPSLADRLNFPEHTYFDVAIVIIGFILLGKYLESRSKLKTGEAIEKLLELQAKTAIVVRDGTEVEIPISDVVVGDIFIVKPGQKVAVDGQIVSGHSSVDESMITGESMPVGKKEGDVIIGGTMNKQGMLRVKATKIGSETMLAQIIRMVEEAQGSKAPIETLADTVSSVFVPLVLVIAVGTFGIWSVAGIFGFLPLSTALSFAFISMVGILVIACPCALGLATPTAIIVGVGQGAKHGILIKDAASLETLHKATAVVFDKTGTLTRGEPEVTDIVTTDDTSKQQVLRIAASVEKHSSHPLADAIVRHAQEEELRLTDTAGFETVEGKGVKGKMDDEVILVGNKALLESHGIKPALEKDFERISQEGKTVVYVVLKDRVIGLIAVADVVKPESKEIIQKLHQMKLHVAMITGDHANVADAVARELGIDIVFSQVLPQDKASKVQELQQKGYVVAMVGDGINDAPALAQADVGVAMGTGTDVAIEAADITLLKGNLVKLLQAITLSKKTFTVIKQNLFWAFAYNVVGIPVAAGVLYPLFGIFLSPVFAGAAMALSSVSVVTNSLRLKNSKLYQH